MSPQEWYGCFRHSWQNLLVPEAFQHPGKYNRGVLDLSLIHISEPTRPY